MEGGLSQELANTHEKEQNIKYFKGEKSLIEYDDPHSDFVEDTFCFVLEYHKRAWPNFPWEPRR